MPGCGSDEEPCGLEGFHRENQNESESESEWRLWYMCESISTSEKTSTDQAVQVQERKQR